MVSERVVRPWFGSVPVWLKLGACVGLCYLWEGVLECRSGVCPTLKKLKGLSMYVSLSFTPPIANQFWVWTSFELMCMTLCLWSNWYKKKNGIRAVARPLICHFPQLINCVHVPTHEGTCWSTESGACAMLNKFKGSSVYISLWVSPRGMGWVGPIPIPIPIPILAVPILYPFFFLIFNTHTHDRWGWILRVLSGYGFFAGPT